EIPRVLPRIPQRLSQLSEDNLSAPPPTGALIPEWDADSVFTKNTRRDVIRELQRWKPRPSEETLEAIIKDLTMAILNAKYAFAEAAPTEVSGLRTHLARIEGLAKRLRRDLDALRPVPGQLTLDEFMRILDECCPPPRELAHHLKTLELAAKKIRPGPQTIGHPKAGTIKTRYLAAQARTILQKHGIRA